MTLCKCRACDKIYYEHKSRADYKGFCSAKCLHVKARECGYRKYKNWFIHPGEYDCLNRHKEIGSVIIEGK